MPIKIISKLESSGIHPIVSDYDLEGGFRSVLTLGERDTIPTEKRMDGMRVFVKDIGNGISKDFTLFLGTVDNDLSNNSNWVDTDVLLRYRKINFTKPPQIFVLIPHEEIHFAHNFYNKGVTEIQGGVGTDDYGQGVAIPTYAILSVDGVIQNEGLIINNGLIIN